MAPVRTTPITLLARRYARLWTLLAAPPDPAHIPPRAQAVADCIRERGASFFDELVEATGLLRTQVEEALAELVAVGLANSDSFAGLRALLVPSDRRKPFAGGRRRRRTALFGMEDAGRWALARRAHPKHGSAQPDPDAVEHVARTLLRRYGVVFWRRLEREADWLPPWRDLLRVYRRLEARGEIRGGRSSRVLPANSSRSPKPSGCCGKGGARRRRAPGCPSPVPIRSTWRASSLRARSLRPSPATACSTATGLPVALLAGGEVHFLEALPAKEQWEARNALLRRAVPPTLADFS